METPIAIDLQASGVTRPAFFFRGLRWRPRICFVAPYAYPLFDSDSNSRFGGAEVRAARLAKGLAKRYTGDVSFIVLNHGQSRFQKIDGLEILAYRTNRQETPLYDGWRVWSSKKRDAFISETPEDIRAYYLDLNRVATYCEADADLYIGFGVNDWTAELAAFARSAKRPLVLFTSSDEDLSDLYQPGSKAINSYFSRADRCHFAIHNCYRLVVQTETQKELARNRFGREAEIIRSPIEISSWTQQPEDRRQRVVWIGRADNVKQPDLFLSLAREFPEVAFEMILGENLEDIARPIYENKPDNLTITERIQPDMIVNWIAGATALVNTSRFEGFPNTFLEAWAVGVPVLSLNVDPDGVIERFGCGIVANGDQQRFAIGLRRLVDDTEFRKETGQRGRSYVEESHKLAKAVDRLEDICTKTTSPVIASIIRKQLRYWRLAFPLNKISEYLHWRLKVPAARGLRHQFVVGKDTSSTEAGSANAIPFSSSQEKVHVCFVAPYTYSLFNPDTQFPFGGIEVQAHLLASGLARREQYDVSFMVWSHGKDTAQKRFGVSLGTIEPYPDPFFAEANKWVRSFVAATYGAAIGGIERVTENPPQPSNPKAENSGPGKAPSVRAFLSPIAWVIISYVTNKMFRRRVRTVLGGVRTDLAKRIMNIGRYQKYQEVDADVYVGFGASNLMAELASFCKVEEKKLILLSASDSDFSADYYKGSKKKNDYGDLGDNCHFSILSADRLVVQTAAQGKLARDGFGVGSVVIPNPVNLEIQSEPRKPWSDRRYVAWIGKADDIKQPDILVALARSLPDIEFHIIMNSSRPEVQQRVLDNLPANVTYKENLPYSEIPLFLQDALALVNTSRFEGMPNAALEACRAGAPVVSLNVDPAGMLKEGGCGLCANGSFERLASNLRNLVDNTEEWGRFHNNAIDYVGRHHDQDTCVDALAAEISNLHPVAVSSNLKANSLGY
ncbi:MAG: glycosyltransferase family 4 protein [Rhodospirillales bacterium]|nr:glycosyltransferase family 4 protein [Rhodospirillales bacterium]